MRETIYEPELDFNAPPAEDTLDQKFAAYDPKHPEAWQCFEDIALEHIKDNNETYISPRDLFPEIRRRLGYAPNNNYSRCYGDKFKAKYPKYASFFMERKRADGKMKRVYA